MITDQETHLKDFVASLFFYLEMQYLDISLDALMIWFKKLKSSIETNMDLMILTGSLICYQGSIIIINFLKHCETESNPTSNTNGTTTETTL